MKAWLLAGGVLGALLCACNEQQPPAQPGSFDRPTRVAFACFDLKNPEEPRVASLASCDFGNTEAVSEGVITHALHALVVQSSRGEVAAVDLLNRRTLDSRRDIPGYTFLPVGELPTAIVVPTIARHAQYTYVANAGSRDITVLRTIAFRELGAKDSPIVQTLQLPGGSRDVPYDMVLSPDPDEDALFVSMPQTGRLLRVPIQRCNASEPAPADAGEPMSDAGEDAGMSLPPEEPEEPRPCAEGELDANGITEIPLRDSVADSAMDQSPDVPREPYAKVCSYTGAISNASLPLPALPADAANIQPRPSGMAVDNFCEAGEPCHQRLLVADQGLPLIHVIDFAAAKSGGDAVQIPIRTGVPTTAVAVTPRVPVDRSADPAETQYVYAIDATDGSVLVTENGRLLEVGAGGARPDRVSLGGGSTVPIAMSLSVLTPDFNVHGPANQHTEQLPAGSTVPDPSDGKFCTDTAHAIRTNLRLRGVFLAVGSADGSVRVIDIHDMDLAECRSCDKYQAGCNECAPGEGNRCDACAVENWDPYPVVRHRPRIAVTADRNADTPRLAPIAAPRFVTANTVVSVRVTGTTSDPVIRGLECVECGEGQVLAFPDESLVDATEETTTDGTTSSSAPCASGSARVCVQDDPWTVIDDWVAVHQCVIPGSRGGEANLVETDGDYELQVEGRFCELGVLGADALGGKPGDRLAIAGPLPPDAAIVEAAPHASSESSTARRTFEADVLAACKRLVSERDNTDNPVPIAFPIRAAYSDRLELGSNLVTRPIGLPPEFENDAQFVQKCFGGMPLTYEVRAGAGYLVLSRNDARFAHNVRAEDGNHCARDESLARVFNARAYEDEPFDNGSVKFQIRGGATPPKIDTTLVIGLVATTPKTIMNASVSVNQQVVAALPVDLRWSSADDALYMVDVASRGLLQILVDPWPITGVSRSFQ